MVKKQNYSHDIHLPTKDLITFIESITNGKRVAGATHNFYRYPARYSPDFAREAIRLFSNPGDTVLDPFMGGGTTLVEGLRLGRNVIGSDINQLSCFIATAKTTHLSHKERDELVHWIESYERTLLNSLNFSLIHNDEKYNYLKSLDTDDVQHIKQIMIATLNSFKIVQYKNTERFLRCALLNTSQWALDNRYSIPSIEEFRGKFLADIHEMIKLLNEYQNEVNRYATSPDIRIINCKAEDLCQQSKGITVPKLILTSPPYPGVHVLYHRWQIKGRKETAAPYFIANCNDGQPESYYTFGPRKQKNCVEYFSNLERSFHSLSSISGKETIVIQIIAFSEPEWQLPTYLGIMEKCGFAETQLHRNSTKSEDRIWRNVPSRKWYARNKGEIPSSKEVILIHKKI